MAQGASSLIYNRYCRVSGSRDLTRLDKHTLVLHALEAEAMTLVTARNKAAFVAADSQGTYALMV